jgi:hypothetical protein
VSQDAAASRARPKRSCHTDNACRGIQPAQTNCDAACGASLASARLFSTASTECVLLCCGCEARGPTASPTTSPTTLAKRKHPRPRNQEAGVRWPTGSHHEHGSILAGLGGVVHVILRRWYRFPLQLEHIQRVLCGVHVIRSTLERLEA